MNCTILEPFQTIHFTDWVDKENDKFRNMQISDIRKMASSNEG